MPNHTVTKYEIQSLMPAPSGTEAAFKEGDGFLYEAVFAFAVARVTHQDFDERGREASALKNAPNEVVGLLLPTDEPTFAHDMICEETANFAGYRRVGSP